MGKRARRRFRSQTSFWTVSSWASRKVLRTRCLCCRTVKRLPREDAADPVFSNSIRGTPRRLMPDDERREPGKPKQLPLRIDVYPVHTDLLLPINTEPARQRRVYIRNSVELARYGYTPGCIGCEAAMTQGPSRDHRVRCGTRVIQAMSSDGDLSARVREAHERISRSVSDAEPSMKKGEIYRTHDCTCFTCDFDVTHSVCTRCAWWIIIVISIVTKNCFSHS